MTGMDDKYNNEKGELGIFIIVGNYTSYKAECSSHHAENTFLCMRQNLRGPTPSTTEMNDRYKDEKGDIKMKAAGEIIKDVKKRYDEDKDDWSILGGKDSKGHYDTFIAQPPRLWQIKSEPINPFQAIGLGIGPTRTIDEEILRAIMELGKPINFQALFPQPKDNSAIFVRGVERFSTTATNRLKKEYDNTQNKVDSKLTKELEELVNKKYPSRKTMYL